MAKLFGAQRMVLQAIHDSPTDAAGFVADTQVAQGTNIAIPDLRDWIETLEGEGHVEVAQTTEGLKAAITARGRLALAQSRPLPARSSAVDDAPGQRDVPSSEPSGSSMPGRTLVAASPLNRNPSLEPAFRVRIVAGAGTGTSYLLARDRISIGRSSDCDIPLEHEPYCSRTHAILLWDYATESFSIVSATTTPIVLGDGRRAKGRGARLADGDLLHIGRTAFRFERIDETIAIIDKKNLDPSQTWFPGTSPTSESSAEPTLASDSVRRELTQEDKEKIRTQVWANCDSSGRSTAKCPIDQFPMKITLHTNEHRDADIAAYCQRHGLVTIPKTTDPLRATFAGREWTAEQVRDFSEMALRGQTVRCPVCGTVVRSKIDGDFVILNCLRCSGHGIVPIR